jgi:hypothetical protein
LSRSDARIVAHYHGATGFEAPPLLPALFARDFVHILFPARHEEVQRLAADNPARSLFGLAEELSQDALPDLIAADSNTASDALDRQRAWAAGSALCVLVRVEFLPLCLGKSPSAAVSAILGDGFRFAGLVHPLTQLTPSTKPSGEELPVHADAVFVRDISRLTEMCHSQEQRYLRLRKLAFLSIAFGQLKYALKALGKANELAVDSAVPGLRHRNYDRFLNDLAAAAADSVQFEKSAATRAGSGLPLELIASGGRLRTLARRLRAILTIMRGGAPATVWVPGFASRGDPYAYWWLPLIVRGSLGMIRRVWRSWEVLTAGVPLNAAYNPPGDSSGMSPQETMLEAYGFWVLARETYAERMSGARR